MQQSINFCTQPPTNSDVKSYGRRADILRALDRYGSLSVHGLSQIVIPRIKDRRLRDALFRLEKRGLIYKRFDCLPNNSAGFYENSRCYKVQNEIRNILGANYDPFKDARVRDQELIHNEQVAIWHTRFESLFYDARAYFDHEILQSEKSKNILWIDYNSFRKRPDILISFGSGKNSNQDESGNIAIEVERSRRSRKHGRHEEICVSGICHDKRNVR